MNFSYTIECLKREREILVRCLKAGEQEQVKNKAELDTAIAWLEKIAEMGFMHPKKYDFIVLPDMHKEDGCRGLFSEYHILDDCEIADRSDWIELTNEHGQPITLIMEDILMKRK